MVGRLTAGVGAIGVCRAKAMFNLHEYDGNLLTDRKF